MAQRKKLDTGPHPTEYTDPEPKSKIGINFDAIRSLALHGPVDKLEGLYRHANRCLGYLGLESGKPFESVEKSNTYPLQHDIMRWMDGIGKRGRYMRGDRSFLKDFHATMRIRLPKSFLEQVESEED